MGDLTEAEQRKLIALLTRVRERIDKTSQPKPEPLYEEPTLHELNICRSYIYGSIYAPLFLARCRAKPVR